MNALIRIIGSIMHRLLFWHAVWNNETLKKKSGIHTTARFITSKSNPRLASISNPERLIIGEQTKIHCEVCLDCGGGVEIGRYCHFGCGLSILTQNHQYEGEEIPYDKTFIDKKVTIGDFVWIGSDVKIMPGVSIGEGAIISMGAVIAKDVPRGAMVMGIPARTCRSRDMERFDRLKAERKFR